MKLLVGLGNPGEKYTNTRHNVGFLFIDYFLSQHPDIFSQWKRNTNANAEIAEGKNSNEKIILAKPQTFMNNSGQSVSSLIKRFHFDFKTDSLIVIHDEYDLFFGSYKIQEGRGAAGHNGVKSIFEHLNSQDFTRVRIGIKPENLKIPDLGIEKFVLERFIKREQADLSAQIFPQITEEINRLVV